MEYLIAFIGILVGIVGGLGGALNASKLKNKVLKAENEMKKDNIEMNKEITDVINEPDTKKTDIKSGVINKL